MSQPESSPNPNNQPPPTDGLALASLIVGALALLSSFIVIGVFLGLIGLLLGTLHLRKSTHSIKIAWSGIVLSGLGLCVSLMFIGLWFIVYKSFVHNHDFMNTSLSQWEGVIAPDITVVTVDGETFQLSEAKGKRVIIDVWATWCPPCVMEIPHFNTLREEFSEEELMIVAITDEDADTLLEFLEKNPMNYLVGADQSQYLPDDNYELP